MDQNEEQLRQECWTKRFYSYGTARIFEKRANDINRKRKIITFLGLATPLTIGAFVTAFSIDSGILRYILIPAAGLVALVQTVMSLWSLVAKWDERYSYSIAAIRINTKLTAEFEVLAKSDINKIKRDINRLREEYQRQEIEDTAQHITDKEKRYAMRQSLFQYKLKCETCGKIPDSLSPSDCDTCGNY